MSQSDLIDKIKSYGVVPMKQELNVAFKLFKKYSLINFDENDHGEDMKIQLYPSLQFGWDIPQFQTVADEYLKRNETDEETADDSEEEIQQINSEDYGENEV